MRFVTLNLWGTHPPFARRIQVAAAQLGPIAPEVILLQEVRCGDGLVNTGEQLAALLGSEWSTAYTCATRGEAGAFGAGSAAGEEGLAILARRPIADVQSVVLPESRPDEQRILLSARVGEVWVHTTHLHYRMTDGVARERQVLAIDQRVRSLSADAVHVLGGDFNATPDSDEIRFLCGRHTVDGRRAFWQDAFRTARPEERGFTWARRNPNTEELAFLERDRRIDYLFVRPERRDGTGRVLDARVVLDAPGEDGVWPSDHFAVMADVRV